MTTRTKLWQTLALSVSMGAVATSSMAMEEEFSKKQPKENHKNLLNSALQKSKNVNTKRPLAGLNAQQEIMGNIGSYLSPQDGENLFKANPGLFAREGGGFIGKQFTQRQRREFAQTLRDKFPVLLNESMNLDQDQDFVNKIRQIYPKDTADILLGCLYLAAGKFDAGMYLFKGKTLPKSLQERLNDAAYYGELGFTDKTGLKYLEDGVKDHKDMHAQECLNHAAYHGTLGFTNKTGLEYLKNRVIKHKDTNARKKLNEAAYHGDLGFTDPIARKKYLEERANKYNDAHAQELLNAAARDSNLGFTNETKEGEYLVKIALDENNPGSKKAQKRLNEVAYEGELQFTDKTNKERQDYLEERANKYKDAHAQQMLNRAAYKGTLGFRDKTNKERQKYLVKIALDENNPGSKKAQKRLNEVAYYGELEFTDETGLKYLEERANKYKDAHAQQMLNWAAFNGGFKFRDKTNKERQEYLVKIALDENNPGSKNAQERLYEAARGGKIGLNQNANLPWFFEFYNVVQSMGNEHVKQPPAPQNNENEITENNNNIEDID